MRRLLCSLLVGVVAFGCASAQPPSGWQVGGAPLLLSAARWATDEGLVELAPDGSVLVDGEARFVIDAAGRVYDLDLEPVALLQPDGRLVGADDRGWGVVGSMHASLPGAAEAWLSVLPDGTVVRYGDEGERIAGGLWQGCGPAPSAAQACVLVTHLVLLEAELRRRRVPGPGLGVGFGIVIIR
jgi:hypothetical protein